MSWVGWLGSRGAYISRSPTETRPNISPLDLYQLAQTKTEQELFDAIKRPANRRNTSFNLATYVPVTTSAEDDKMPDYSQLFTDSQIFQFGIVKDI